MSSNHDRRLEEAEIEIAYQRETIDSLSKAVSDQWKLIDGLKADLTRLKDSLQSMEARIPIDGPEPPPPHY